MRIRGILLCLAILPALTSCAIIQRDRCYLPETRYMAMKAIFTSTGSYQRVAQAMEDEGWARCEINTFRYRLRKDLGMDDPEYDILFRERTVDRKDLDFEPGRVENAVQ